MPKLEDLAFKLILQLHKARASQSPLDQQIIQEANDMIQQLQSQASQSLQL